MSLLAAWCRLFAPSVVLATTTIILTSCLGIILVGFPPVKASIDAIVLCNNNNNDPNVGTLCAYREYPDPLYYYSPSLLKRFVFVTGVANGTNISDTLQPVLSDPSSIFSFDRESCISTLATAFDNRSGLGQSLQ